MTSKWLLVCLMAAMSAYGQGRAPRARTIAMHPTTRGFLGVGVAEIDTERAKALNLKDEHGAEIKSLDQDSPAAKAGLKVGDVVLEYNGQRIEGVEQFIRMVRETPGGRKAVMSISRDGNTQTVSATLGSRPANDFELFFNGGAPPMPPMPAMPNLPNMPNGPMVPPVPPVPSIGHVQIPDLPRNFFSWQSSTLGIETEALNPQLADFFGVKEGVLVRSVASKSSADKAGVKAGDVIVKVDGSAVTSPRAISTMLRSNRSKKSVQLGVVRNRKEMTLDVKLDDVSQGGFGGDREVL